MTMRHLGLSIYPDHSNMEEDKKYLELGHKYGFKRIFMSMLEISDNSEDTLEKYREIIQYGNKLGYETFIDLAPQIFTKLGISYQDLKIFHDLGATGLRLDEAFDGETEAMMTYNPYGLIIELNMSNNVDYLNNILSYQASTPFIYGCHNFYPQKGTGLPYDFFIECSKRFKHFGIHSAAFVSSQVGKMGPWNVTDGLPTLEQCRSLPISVQAKLLWTTGLIDDVIIGNAYASEDELKALSEVNPYQLELEVEAVSEINEIERTIVNVPQHFRRGDMTSAVVRSTMPRVTYHDEANPAHDNQAEFAYGDVVVGNDDFGVYKNELQIVLEPHSDTRKNKVGTIRKDEQFLLDFIKPWTKFKLVCK